VYVCVRVCVVCVVCVVLEHAVSRIVIKMRQPVC